MAWDDAINARVGTLGVSSRNLKIFLVYLSISSRNRLAERYRHFYHKGSYLVVFSLTVRSHRKVVVGLIIKQEICKRTGVRNGVSTFSSSSVGGKWMGETVAGDAWRKNEIKVV